MKNKVKGKVKELEERTIQSAKSLTEHIEALGLSTQQKERLNHLILKHVDDCIHWGIQVKLAYMLEEGKNDKKTMYEI